MANREPKTHGLGDLLPVLGAVAAVLALTAGLMRYAAECSASSDTDSG